MQVACLDLYYRHNIRLPVTSPQKLCHIVTSPHFEKVRGDVGIVGKCVGVWGEMWEEV